MHFIVHIFQYVDICFVPIKEYPVAVLNIVFNMGTPFFLSKIIIQLYFKEFL